MLTLITPVCLYLWDVKKNGEKRADPQINTILTVQVPKGAIKTNLGNLRINFDIYLTDKRKLWKMGKV